MDKKLETLRLEVKDLVAVVFPKKKEETKPGRMDTMHSGAGRIIQGISKELGEADSKDLRSGPPDLSEMSGGDGDHQFY